MGPSTLGHLRLRLCFGERRFHTLFFRENKYKRTKTCNRPEADVSESVVQIDAAFLNGVGLHDALLGGEMKEQDPRSWTK